MTTDPGNNNADLTESFDVVVTLEDPCLTAVISPPTPVNQEQWINDDPVTYLLDGFTVSPAFCASRLEV